MTRRTILEKPKPNMAVVYGAPRAPVKPLPAERSFRDQKRPQWSRSSTVARRSGPGVSAGRRPATHRPGRPKPKFHVRKAAFLGLDEAKAHLVAELARKVPT